MSPMVIISTSTNRKDAPLAHQRHVICDLCLIAVTEGKVATEERDFVHAVGRDPELSATV